jgi:hypothetical protein
MGTVKILTLQCYLCKHKRFDLKEALPCKLIFLQHLLFNVYIMLLTYVYK